ncbi:MAG: isopeptide-forming domain-containing fimbrial protein [Oscillospiraceae bacterium]|nr:isopeptide-forming domain-containing fimbrial protein [Oscillospiraceae bacterium]
MKRKRLLTMIRGKPNTRGCSETATLYVHNDLQINKDGNEMKHTKKFMAILLTIILALTIGFSVFAEGETKNDSITVNGAKIGETYNLYKLFDLSVNLETQPAAYSYKVNSDWADFFKAAEEGAAAGPGAQYITLNKEGYVTAISDVAALAKAAAEWEGKPAAIKSIKFEEATVNTVVFENLDDGYWLITSTLGTIAMTETTPDKSAVKVNEKNPEDTIEKTVEENENGTFGERNDAQIGDTVNFQSTIRIVKGTRNVVVHDKMDQGLTYTPGSVAIEGLTKGREYTVNESPEDPEDGDTFDITFAQSWIDGLDFGTAGFKEYVITYTATINEKAVVKDGNGVAIVDQYNRTHVSFGDSAKSEEATTTTTTHKFSVFKHAENATDNLAGAVFSLKKAETVVKLVKLDDNNYRVAMENEKGAEETFTTVEEGDIVIWGVDAEIEYTLKEITPPAGYNKLEEAVPLTVDRENSIRLDVENKSGKELPSTGGIGTTLFYVIGGIMLIGAGLVLVARKRANIQ